MKGKYAAKADRRRELTGLEDRAVAAERERDRLGAELADLREDSERKIADLRAQARRLRDQRDTGAAPRIAELEAANSRLRARCKAAEVMMSARSGEGEGALRLSGGPLADLDVIDVYASRTRPHRGGRNWLADATDSLGMAKHLDAEARRTQADARARLLEDAGLLCIYAYDTADSSVSIDWNCNPLADPAINLSACITVERAAADTQADSVTATAILPYKELARLARALNESTDDAASKGGDLLGDAERLKPVSRNLADDPAD